MIRTCATLTLCLGLPRGSITFITSQNIRRIPEGFLRPSVLRASARLGGRQPHLRRRHSRSLIASLSTGKGTEIKLANVEKVVRLVRICVVECASSVGSSSGQWIMYVYSVIYVFRFIHETFLHAVASSEFLKSGKICYYYTVKVLKMAKLPFSPCSRLLQ